MRSPDPDQQLTSNRPAPAAPGPARPPAAGLLDLDTLENGHPVPAPAHRRAVPVPRRGRRGDRLTAAADLAESGPSRRAHTHRRLVPPTALSAAHGTQTTLGVALLGGGLGVSSAMSAPCRLLSRSVISFLLWVPLVGSGLLSGCCQSLLAWLGRCEVCKIAESVSSPCGLGAGVHGGLTLLVILHGLCPSRTGDSQPTGTKPSRRAAPNGDHGPPSRFPWSW